MDGSVLVKSEAVDQLPIYIIDVFNFATNLDDGGADMTGTKGAESGLVGDVDAEEDAVDNEFEGLGRCYCNFLYDCTF